ncbi:MAG: hypothetical protein LBD51_06920 [Bifidobacteriaceae bacterium]|nr:hypothetical protein [Bifidobacteriaceae bacterium]
MTEEAIRRLRPRDALVAALSFALAGGVVALSGLDVWRGLGIARAELAAGATVFAVEPLDPELGLDAAACETMAGGSSITESGALEGDDLVSSAYWEPSGVALPVWDLTLGALRVWWPDAPAEGGVFLGSDLAEVTGAGRGATVSVDGERFQVAGVLPDAVRPAEWQARLVRVVPSQDMTRATQCWYRVERPFVTVAVLFAEAAFPDAGIVVTAFRRADALSQTPTQAVLAGPGQWAWLVALGVATFIVLIMGLMGRQEAGIYLATGSGRVDLWLMSQVKSLFVVIVPTCLGTAATAVALAWSRIVPNSPDVLWYVAQPACLLVTGWTLLLPFIDLACSSGSIARNLKS